MAKINVRSPYYITFDTTNLTSVELEIYIYDGTQTTDRGSLTYKLNSFAVSNKCQFEISEVIRDYFENNFDGDYSSQNFWVDYRSTEYVQNVAQTQSGYTQLVAFYGYGYFEDGANPTNDSGLLQTNTKIVKLDDAPAVIPVYTEITNQVTYELNGEQIYTKAISDSNEADEQIEYVTSGVNGADEFEDRVKQDGGTFEDSSCLQEFVDDFTLFDFDTIYVETDDEVIKITVENIKECKYQPYKCTFVNKFGALQDVWFFKRSNEIINTKVEDFKRNTVVDGSYNISRHQRKIFDKNAQEKLTLNTGYYPEEYNDVFKEMQLSEDCWIEINSQTLPINVKAGSFNYKTVVNDKLISYTIEVDFAFDTINNVR